VEESIKSSDLRKMGLQCIDKPSKVMLKPTHKIRDMQWPSGRLYRMVFTSMSDPSVVLDVELHAFNLRSLMLNVMRQIASLNRRFVARHFTVTLSYKQPIKQTQREHIKFMEGHAITPHETPDIPSTDQPIDQELHL
jgi:hypothetical protein